MKKIIVTLLVVGIGIAGFYFVSTSTNTDTQGGITKNRHLESERFVVSAQSGTDEIVIDQVVMDKPGFVVIRESINDRPGQIIEASDLLKEGIHTNVSINLGGVQEINGIDISGEFPLVIDFIAVVYTDDGDGGFNPLLDNVAYAENAALAKYVSTGEQAPESSVVPNMQSKAGDLAAATVIYTDEGFSPNTVEISNGDTVLFINKSSRPMWVASDLHPAHNVLPTFDQFGTSAIGESYSYTFDRFGEWRYHDHVNASEVGVIIVN